MTGFSGSPRLLRGGIVLVDPDSAAVQRVIALQYNPDTLTRTLAVQGVGADSGDRSEALRLKGPPIETIKVDAEIDATDQLEHPDQFPDTAQLGISPQLAALEEIVYPATADLLRNDVLAQAGTLEIAPMESALTLFVWSRNRVIPVRITEFSVTEEAFDTMLNPTRAHVNLGLRVLSTTDLGFRAKGGGIYLAYQRRKEALAARAVQGSLSALGLSGIT
jgi:hypothetical protein